MNITLLSVAFLLVIIIIFFSLKYLSNKKVDKIKQELNFFKKGKEYHKESMLVYSKNHKIIFANRTAKDMFSLEKINDDYIVQTVIGLKVENQDPIDFFDALDRESKERGDNFHLRDATLILNNKKIVVNIYVDRSLWNIDGTITCIIDGEVNSKSSGVSQNGEIDFLTGLPSQFKALSDINSLVIESKKASESFSIFLIGIDYFSSIQSTLGQAYTNNVLKKIAKYFNQKCKLNLNIYRMDCDKFLIVSKNTKSVNEARKVAIELISTISNFTKDEITTNITVSSGLVQYPEHGENATKLINHVYLALYEAQKDSVSNIGVFLTENSTMRKDEIKMNEEIRIGLKNREFVLYYQPIFQLKDNQMVGAEALIRWNHPRMGMISANKFLSVAEKTGLIVDIGEYAFKEVIKQRNEWDKLGYNKFQITLNLSLREMQVDKLIEKITILFKDFNVNPKEFNLDITEEDAMVNLEKTQADFAFFKELGLSISLDNFGASQSSLKHLLTLPLSTVKIDRSLIFDLSYNDDHKLAVKGIIDLLHTFNYVVVAEGVETSKEVKILKELKCDQAQGYIFATPLPVKEFQELLKI